MERKQIEIQKILDYEARSHWLSPWIWFGWGQELLAWYLSKKVKRKYNRYMKSITWSNYFKN